MPNAATEAVEEFTKKTPRGEIPVYNLNASDVALKAAYDYINDPRSSIIDALSTMVVNETQVKLYAWYDNEWGYANRLVDVVNMVSKSI